MGDGNIKKVLGGTREGPVFGGTKGRVETRSQRGLVKAWRYQVGGRTLLFKTSSDPVPTAPLSSTVKCLPVREETYYASNGSE